MWAETMARGQKHKSLKIGDLNAMWAETWAEWAEWVFVFAHAKTAWNKGWRRNGQNGQVCGRVSTHEYIFCERHSLFHPRRFLCLTSQKVPILPNLTKPA